MPVRRAGHASLAALAILLLSSTAHAQSIWTSPGNADWNVGSNWSPAGVPTATSDVVIDAGGQAQIGTFGAPAAVSGTLTLGSTAGSSGSLTINNNAATLDTTATTATRIGALGTGVMTVTRAGSIWTNHGGLIIGDASGSQGTLTVDMAGKVIANGTAGTATVIANIAGSTGRLAVDGAGSSFSTIGKLTVANGGTGTLRVSAGAEVSNDSASVGGLAGSTGDATVTGAGSTWTTTKTLTIGDAGNGSLLVEAKGVATDADGVIGAQAGSTGTAKVSGAGSTWTNSGSLTVGNSGTGGLTVEAAGSVTDASASIGALTGSKGTAKVTGTGSNWTTTNGLTVGGAGTGDLTVEGGAAVSSGSADIGSAATGIGTAVVTGANSAWTNTNALIVGNAGNGGLTVQAGGSVTSGDTTIGAVAKGVGKATVTGLNSSLAVDGTLTVGDAGEGSLTVAASGTTTATDMVVGHAAAGKGTVLVTETGSALDVDTSLVLGDAGNGSLSVTEGGKASAASATIGSAATGVGTATLDGAGSSLAVAGPLVLGDAGNGTLTVQQSASATSQSATLGASLGGKGTATVTGDGSSWTNTAAMTIGKLGTGSLSVLAAGTVKTASTTLGDGATGIGTALVNGQGSSWTNTGNMTVGNSGTGTLTLTNEGALSVGGGTGVVTLASAAGSKGTLLIGDGAGAGTLAAGEIKGGAGTALLVFNHAEGAYEFEPLISGSVALRQIGSGATVLMAANTYTGATSVEAGTLRSGIDNAISTVSAVSVDDGAMLDLAGFDQVLATLDNAGTVSTAGTEAGATLSVSGDYAGTGTLILGAKLGGSNSITDKLVVEGDVSGSTLVGIANLDGKGARTTGDGIQVITVAGDSPAGAFTGTRTIAGAWDYRLYQGGVGADADDGNWYLRSDLAKSAQIYRAYPSTLLAYGMESIGTLRQRTGGWTNGVAISNLPGGAWARVVGSGISSTPADGSPYDQSLQFGQAGAEFELPVNGPGSLSAGAMVSIGKSSATVDVASHGESGSGTIDSNAYGVGANLTWRGNDGFYADAVGQMTFYDTSFNEGGFGTLASGASATGGAASLEVGKTIALGTSFAIVPQAQIVYSNVSIDSFTDRDDVTVPSTSADTLVGRAGVRLETGGFVDSSTADAMRFNAYLVANIAYAFVGGTEIAIADTVLAQTQNALSGELGAGATLSIGSRFNLYGEASYATSSLSFDEDTRWSANFGVRVNW